MRRALIGCCAALLIWAGTAGYGAAQTTSARSDSDELASRAFELAAAGRYQPAARLYRRALEVDRTNRRAYIGLSTVLDAQGRHGEALELLETAVANAGWSWQLGLQQGIHLTRLQRWPAAQTALERTLRVRPSDYQAAYYLANAHLARAAWPDAVAAFDRYFQNRPSALADRDNSVRTRRAYALLQRGAVAEARRELAAVVKADPDSNSATMLLFTALAKSGRCARALTLYPRLQPLTGATPTTLFNAAVCRFRVGDGDGALAMLEELRGESGLPAQALLLTARIHAAAQRPRQAIASYRAAIDAGLSVEVELATLLAARGKQRQVADLLWPLIQAGTDRPPLLRLAATALIDTRELDRALQVTQRLVAGAPENGDWLLHARVLLGRKQWPEAEKASLQVLASKPKNRRAGRYLRRALEQQATAAFRAGDREGAHQLLTRAVAADPAATDAAHNLAALELVRGNPTAVVTLLADRVTRLSSPDKGRLLLGRAYLQLGKLAEASRYLEQLIADPDTNPRHRALALSQLAQGIARSAPARAIALVGRARKLAAGSPSTIAALDNAEANARLALAESAFGRGAMRTMRDELARVDRDQLAGPARLRATLLGLFATGHQRGLTAALKQLAEISDDQLTTASGDGLPAAAVRHAIAMELGVELIRRASDGSRLLRSHGSGLHTLARDTPLVRAMLGAWYDQLLDWAISRKATALIRQLARTVPSWLQSPAFRHNLIVATANKSLTAAQRQQLAEVADQVPDAIINLAADAERRGDHATVIRYLRQLPARRRTGALADWLRWKELLHGAP